MITLKFYLRESRNRKGGDGVLYFIVNADTLVWISTELFLHPDHWDQKKEKIRPSWYNYSHDSAKITKLRLSAELYLQQVNNGALLFSKKDFETAVFEGSVNDVQNPTIEKLFLQYQEVNTICDKRKDHYNVMIGELQEMLPGIRLKDITHLLGLKYEKKLTDKGNCRNTISAKMKKLKALLHFAQELKLIHEDPLKSIKLSSNRTRRFALTKNELVKLHDQYDNGKKFTPTQINVLRYYLFCCYTGLRYGDVKDLRMTNIINDIIYIDMNKTGDPVAIPLIPDATSLIDPQVNKKCFRVFSNEKTNLYLKEIAKAAGIHKPLTFHTARHTFATISISLGMPIKTVSKILGHTKVSTTEIYIHVLNEMIASEMQKWHGLRVA